MSDDAKLQKLDSQIRAIKKADRNADVTGLLRDALRNTEDQEEKLYILSRLASEYQLLGKLEAAEDAIKKQINLAPDNPEAWLQLASHYYGLVHDLPKALSTVEVAVEKAAREGNFVRQAHAERIRIALEMKNYQVVENSLAKLIEYSPRPGSIDVELESDFLPRIPASGVRNDLVENYKKLAHAK
jgi:tetratricopeptide (TPR) repeat protein